MGLWEELHPNQPVPAPLPNRTGYPKWIDAPTGRMIVYSKAEEADAMAGEEVAPQPKHNALLDEPAVSEKSQLQLKAQELGITIDRRWGASKLRKVIAEHR